MALKAGYIGVKRWIYEKLIKDVNVLINDVSTLKTDSFPYSVASAMGSRNMLKNTATSGTTHNVVITVNADGSMNLAQTADANATKNLNTFTGAQLKKLGSKLILTGGISSNIYLAFRNSDWTLNIKDMGTGAVIETAELVDATTYYISLVIANGTNTNNVVIYPMLKNENDTSSIWSPYAMTNQQLTDEAATLSDSIAALRNLIKSDTFSGTTSASGNLLLSSGTSRIVLAAQAGGKVVIPYNTGGDNANQNAHVQDFNGDAVISTAVSGVYYYIDAPAEQSRSEQTDTRSVEEPEVEPESEPVVKKTTRSKKTTNATE